MLLLDRMCSLCFSASRLSQDPMAEKYRHSHHTPAAPGIPANHRSEICKKMNIRSFISIISLLCCTFMIKAQTLEEMQRKTVPDYIDGSISEYWEISVKNVTDETYFSWIAARPLSEMKTTLSVIREYFFYPKGDLNLFTILTDSVIREPYHPTIGITFIKMIHPGETFKYVFIDKDKAERYLERLVSVSSSDIEKYLDIKSFGISEFGDLLYKDDYVLIR